MSLCGASGKGFFSKSADDVPHLAKQVTFKPQPALHQRRAGPQGGVGFGLVGLVVAADVHGLALDGQEFADDFFFVGGELLCDGLEDGGQFTAGSHSEMFVSYQGSAP